LRGGVDDAEALFTLLQDPVHAKAWGVDPRCIVLAGHSYGGYVAARTASAHPKVLGVALIAPWDISYDGRALVALSAKQHEAAGAPDFDDDIVGDCQARLQPR
jgi:pimeloyl-ACP methyl ester carboxylesterase